MTACGFCVVAALSRYTSGLPWTRRCRIGKSGADRVHVEALMCGAGATDAHGVVLMRMRQTCPCELTLQALLDAGATASSGMRFSTSAANA